MPKTHRLCQIICVLLFAGLAGCSPNAAPPAANSTPKNAAANSSDKKNAHDHAAHDHSEWWCAEHGVPEDECGRCSPKLAAQFQKKGDWCKEHDRPDSQCFICHPE